MPADLLSRISAAAATRLMLFVERPRPMITRPSPQPPLERSRSSRPAPAFGRSVQSRAREAHAARAQLHAADLPRAHERLQSGARDAEKRPGRLCTSSARRGGRSGDGLRSCLLHAGLSFHVRLLPFTKCYLARPRALTLLPRKKVCVSSEIAELRRQREWARGGDAAQRGEDARPGLQHRRPSRHDARRQGRRAWRGAHRRAAASAQPGVDDLDDQAISGCSFYNRKRIGR